MIEAVVTFVLLMLSSLITPWFLNNLVNKIKDRPYNFFSTILFLASHLVSLLVIIGFAVVNKFVGIPMSITGFTICSFFSLFFGSLFYCSGADGCAGHSVGMKYFIRSSVVFNLLISIFGTSFV